MEPKNILKIYIAVVLAALAFSSALASCTPAYPACGDYCASTDKSKCGNTLEANRGITDCTSIGCETTCYGAHGYGVEGTPCDARHDDVCVGNTSSPYDFPLDSTCGDICVSTDKSGCNGAKYFGAASCESVGCELACYEAFPNAFIGAECHAGSNNRFVCIGEHSSIKDSPKIGTHFDSKGNPITCNAADTRTKLFSQVMPMSLPLHFTFGILDKAYFTATDGLACGTSLFGKTASLSGYSRMLPVLSCDADATADVYETHNATRYIFNWTIEYDAIIYVFDPNDPIPMLVGKNITVAETITDAVAAPCAGNNLCYTEAPLSSVDR